MQDELLKSFDGRIMIVTKRCLLLLGPRTVQFYLAGMSTVSRDCVGHKMSLWSSYNHKNIVSIQHFQCWNKMLGCSLQHFPSASSVLGMITSMGQDRLSTDGSVLSLWTFRISPVTALSLSRVIKKRISTFTTFSQYLPYIMLWQCLCQEHSAQRSNYVHTAFITWITLTAKLYLEQ